MAGGDEKERSRRKEIKSISWEFYKEQNNFTAINRRRD